MNPVSRVWTHICPQLRGEYGEKSSDITRYASWVERSEQYKIIQLYWMAGHFNADMSYMAIQERAVQND